MAVSVVGFALLLAGLLVVAGVEPPFAPRSTGEPTALPTAAAANWPTVVVPLPASAQPRSTATLSFLATPPPQFPAWATESAFPAAPYATATPTAARQAPYGWDSLVEPSPVTPPSALATPTRLAPQAGRPLATSTEYSTSGYPGSTPTRNGAALGATTTATASATARPDA